MQRAGLDYSSATLARKDRIFLPIYVGARRGHLRGRPDGRLELIVRGTASEKLLAIDATLHSRRYVHLISEGVAIETFLKGAGPFKDTVYADELKKAEL